MSDQPTVNQTALIDGIYIVIGPINPARPPEPTDPPSVEPPPVVTNEYFVSTTGSDSNPGTTDAPWQTINHGIKQLSAGHCLTLRGGVYPEAIELIGWPGGPLGTSWETAITIRAAAGEAVTLCPPDGKTWAVYLRGSTSGASDAPRWLIFDGILFDCQRIASVGFYVSAWDANVNPANAPAHHIRCVRCRITNVKHSQGFSAMWGSDGCEFLDGEVDNVDGPSHDANNTQGFYVASSDFILRRSHIHHCWGYGVSNLSSLPGFDVNRHIVEGNHVHHCGLGGTGLGGINLGEGVGHFIVNNNVHDNLGPGINLRFNPGPGSTRLVIAANTVLRNQGEGIYISGAQQGTEVHSNIAHGNGGGDYVDLGVGTVVSTNLFGVDPLVVDAAAGNVHLTAGSPARGMGRSHAKIPSDFYGAPRPTSGACDGGAAQYVP